MSSLDPPRLAAPAKGGIRIRLETKENLAFSGFGMDALTFFIRGAEDFPAKIYEQIVGHGKNVIVQPPAKPFGWQHVLPAASIEPVGFADEEALLPAVARTFRGYRLLQEYFAFPQRFLFFRISGLRRCLMDCSGSVVDLVILLDQEDLTLEGRMDAGNIVLHCAPVINLFPKRADIIHLSDKFTEFHVVPTRTRPMDYEVYQITGVTGYGVRSDEKQIFAPFYSASDFEEIGGSGAYFTVNRTSRLMSGNEKEAWPADGLRRQRGLSHRLSMQPRRPTCRIFASWRLTPFVPTGTCLSKWGLGGETDFNLDISSPVGSVRCVSGPAAPRASNAEGEISWRIINHLSSNYLSWWMVRMAKDPLRCEICSGCTATPATCGPKNRSKGCCR